MTRPRFSDEAPSSDTITDYDRRHLTTYLRLLDAEAEEADWQEVSIVVFGLDPINEPGRAERVHASHLARAHWMTANGYEDLIRSKYH